MGQWNRSLTRAAIACVLVFIAVTQFMLVGDDSNYLSRFASPIGRYSHQIISTEVSSNTDGRTFEIVASPDELQNDTSQLNATEQVNATAPAPKVSVPVPVQQYPQLDSFRLLIGVMSPFTRTARRQLVRNAYAQFPKDLPVDIVFVEGNVTTRQPFDEKIQKDLLMQRVASGWENEQYHDILHLDCFENLEKGKTYEYFKKVGTDLQWQYTHVMKTDDDSFVNIPALVEVLKAIPNQRHLYWGTTYTEEDTWRARELWGSGYVLTMDLVHWIATSKIPLQKVNGLEDLCTYNWLVQGNLVDNMIVNRTAFAGYPWPELGEKMYKEENGNGPFQRWNLVTHPLKEDFMFVDTADFYVNLEW